MERPFRILRGSGYALGMTSPDVLVVGAGIIGCSIAYELAGRGASVRVVERRSPGQGATRAAAGLLAPYTEAHQGSPLRDLGIRSLHAWDGFLERVTADAGTTVFARHSGTLDIAYDEAEYRALEGAAARLDLDGVPYEWLDGDKARGRVAGLSEEVRGALAIGVHAFVAAPQAVEALRLASAARGVEFESGVEVTAIRADGGVTLETSRGDMHAPHVVLAGGSWSSLCRIGGLPPLPVQPVRGQLVSLHWPDRLPSTVVWASDCYLVPWPDGTLLVGATVEHVGYDERATAAGVAGLLAAVRRALPGSAEAEFAGVRVGLRPRTPDEIPIVGPSRRIPGLIFAVGHHRNGVLLAPLTAEVVTRLVVDGIEDPDLDRLRPDRFGDY